jgi:hypothetical protein
MQAQFPPQQGPSSPPFGAGPPATGPAAPAKKAKWPLYAGIGCLAATVFCCIVPVSGFFVGKSVLDSDARETADAFVGAGKRGDADALYGMLDSYFAAGTSPEGVRSGLPRCVGLATHTSYEITSVDVDYPLDDFVIANVTYTTPTGVITAGIGIQNDGGMKIGTYYEEGGVESFSCTLRGAY